MKLWDMHPQKHKSARVHVIHIQNAEQVSVHIEFLDHLTFYYLITLHALYGLPAILTLHVLYVADHHENMSV